MVAETVSAVPLSPPLSVPTPVRQEGSGEPPGMTEGTDDASHEVLSCYEMKFQNKPQEVHLNGSHQCLFLILCTQVMPLPARGPELLVSPPGSSEERFLPKHSFLHQSVRSRRDDGDCCIITALK